MHTYVPTQIKAAIKNEAFLSLFIRFLHDMREYKREIWAKGSEKGTSDDFGRNFFFIL